MTGPVQNKHDPLIWDLPLRMWHWTLAGAVSFSLYTGWIGDIELMDWHMTSGYVVLGLVLFRICWALWGGLYARWHNYRPGIMAAMQHFRGQVSEAAHTAPGVWLALGLFGLVALQAVSGLGTSDDIFTQGPLFKHLSEQTSDRLSWLHHRVFWGISGLICIHLLAHVVYAIRKDPAPIAMVTGRKRRLLASTPSFKLRGLATALVCAGVVYYALGLL